ncbi:hypothetical protein K3495_g17075, partial [Podosphaera aphanis]
MVQKIRVCPPARTVMDKLQQQPEKLIIFQTMLTRDPKEFDYSTPQSQDNYPLVNESGSVSTQITDQNTSELGSSRSWSSLTELEENEIDEILETNHQVSENSALRANEISANIDEHNILPEEEQRPRKAPRRNINALAATYETFYTAMAAAVNDPEIIGQKLPYISTLKPPPQTWKQMIRHPESNGFINAAK